MAAVRRQVSRGTSRRRPPSRCGGTDELASCARVTLLGVLITVEGLDGAGKTTLIAGLASELDATVLREPGGVELSERIRELVKDPALDRRPARGGAALPAARAQLVAEKLRPLLDGGDDRDPRPLHRLQPRLPGRRPRARGRGDPDAERVRRPAASPPTRRCCSGSIPRRGSARIAGREADRLELAGGEFFARVAKTYDELAAAGPTGSSSSTPPNRPRPCSPPPSRPSHERKPSPSSPTSSTTRSTTPGQLDELRAQWRDLAPEERDALTPLAKLAAQTHARPRAAEATRTAPRPPTPIATPDEAELRRGSRAASRPSPE